MKASEFQSCLALGLVFWALSGAGSLLAEEPTAQPDERPIAAIVNGDPIYVAEIEQLLAKVRSARQASPDRMPMLQAETLRQVVNQRVVEEAFKRDEVFLKESEIDKKVDKVRAQARAKGLTLDQFTAKQGVTINTLRHEMAWQIAWPKYVERNVIDALEGYFKEHHKDFDGTLVRASHILLRAERPGEGSSQLIERAEKLRAEIEAGKLTFEQAAEKYSVGPSRRQGGDLGFFPRFGVMVEEFSKAAFALAKGEISQPVHTAFGVHLIRATDIKPGTRQWTEAVDQMKSPASLDLFEELAKQERVNAKIEFTGKLPYFNPETGKLVMPGVTK
ncbi:MAG: peptidylprolyl isomerase [Planctomycetia bacterium]|nr:peptidylprolyl isomerase [Planctomycetia bacterium]